MKLARGSRLVVASHNAGKLREIAALLAPLAIEPVGAGELGLPEPEENGTSFAANAIIKARAAALASGFPALADDSGLSVRALHGEPGIHSARWAGEERDFASAIVRVQQALEAAQARDLSAKFVCALALAGREGEALVFEGEVEGRLIFPPRGNRGFGYDPIFVANGMEETFGELEPQRKHAISHRARAFSKLARYIDEQR